MMALSVSNPWEGLRRGSLAAGEGSATAGELPVVPMPSAHPPTSAMIGPPGEPLAADFFRNLIGENIRTVTNKIEKVSTDQSTLSRTVKASKTQIEKTATELFRQASVIDEQRSQLKRMEGRIGRLERPVSQEWTAECRVPESKEVPQSVADRPDLGELPVEEFINGALRIPESELSNEDIKSVTPMKEQGLRTGNLSWLRQKATE